VGRACEGCVGPARRDRAHCLHREEDPVRRRDGFSHRRDVGETVHELGQAGHDLEAGQDLPFRRLCEYPEDVTLEGRTRRDYCRGSVVGGLLDLRRQYGFQSPVVPFDQFEHV